MVILVTINAIVVSQAAGFSTGIGEPLLVTSLAFGRGMPADQPVAGHRMVKGGQRDTTPALWDMTGTAFSRAELASVR